MRLYKLELKRVLTTRTTWLILVALLLLSVLMAYLPVTFVGYYEENAAGEGNTITGLPAIEKIKALQSPWSGIITEELLADALHQYQETVEQYGPTNEPEFPRKVYNEKILPIQPLTKMLREAFADADTGMAMDLMDLTEWDVRAFYEQNHQHLIDLMKLEQEVYPDAQAKALAQYERIETPFAYYSGYNSDAVDYLSLYLLFVVLACIVITAPVFSSEYQTQADDILRSTKLGRSKLAGVKIASALTVSIATGIVGMGIYLTVSNTLFGWETVQSSLQMLFSCVNLPAMTLLEMLLAIAGAGLLSLAAVICCTLFLSAKIKSPTVSMAAALCVCLLPSVLAVLPSMNFVLWIQSLLPSGGVGLLNSFQYALVDFSFLHVGQFCIWKPHALLIIAAVEMLLFILLAKRAYCRHTL